MRNPSALPALGVSWPCHTVLAAAWALPETAVTTTEYFISHCAQPCSLHLDVIFPVVTPFSLKGATSKDTL